MAKYVSAGFKAMVLFWMLASFNCFAQGPKKSSSPDAARRRPELSDTARAISSPLITDLYTADPAAHVFKGRLYIYPSHDIDAGVPNDLSGAQYAMKDYHVYSMDSVGAKVHDHGEILTLEQIPWAGKQLWAPDAAEKDGKYYFYFPARDKEGVFRIGVAVGNQPEGPFKPNPRPIEGAYSIDPAVFKDDDNSHYLYFGGIRGGQLQNWQQGFFDTTQAVRSGNELALGPIVARLDAGMTRLAEPSQAIQILDETGKPLLANDEERRFFEGAWVHRYHGKYYLSYSTGNTHKIVYATGNNPYGPFIYQGVLLNPVIGWTNHQSIVEFKGKSYLFYHDSSLSGGKSNLRCIKMTELHYDGDGRIQTVNAYR